MAVILLFFCPYIYICVGIIFVGVFFFNPPRIQRRPQLLQLLDGEERALLQMADDSCHSIQKNPLGS